jgi:malate permease and related proteins
MFEGVFLIFCFLMIGFGLKLAKKDYSDVLINFCILVAFPALIIQKLYPMKIAVSDLSIVGIAVFSIAFGFFVGFLLSRFLKLGRASAAVVIMACGLGNTSFVGFPFVEALYGADALGYALLFDQFGSFLFLSVFGSMIAAWGAGRDSSPKKLAKSVLTFPPFIAILAALALKLFELPSFVLLGADKLAVTLLPLVTIAVGMKIDVRHIKENINNTAAILTLKMGVVPLAVLAILPSLGIASKVALIESAMPPMVMVAVFAARYGLNEKLAVSVVALGVFASFAVIPLFYYLG